MKNFMLLPGPKVNNQQTNNNENDDEEPEPIQETFSDCEQGTSFYLDFHIRKSFSSDERMPSFNRRGICGKGSSIVTKHNAELCGKRNVARVMNTFPPEFDTGDVLNKMQLPNKVYNQLKIHSYAEEKRMNRLHDKVEKATAV